VPFGLPSIANCNTSNIDIELITNKIVIHDEKITQMMVI